jgi:hypothetical protein
VLLRAILAAELTNLPSQAHGLAVKRHVRGNERVDLKAVLRAAGVALHLGEACRASLAIAAEAPHQKAVDIEPLQLVVYQRQPHLHSTSV